MITKPKALYPISADPITNGHLDIIERASKLFNITVLVGNNHNKKYTFDLETRKYMVKLTTERFKVNVDSFTGLLSDEAFKRGVNVVIRGIRNNTDFDYENTLKTINEDSGIETYFLMCDRNKSHVSSSMVKAIFNDGGDIHEYVPLIVKFNLEKLHNKCIIGVTGLPASGKSTFLDKLSKNRSLFSIIKMDELVHDLYKIPNIINMIKKRFGDEVVDKNNLEINRSVLGDIVFNDGYALEDLNNLLRKPIRHKLRSKLKDMGGFIIVESALFVEHDMMYICNNNIVNIVCDKNTREERLINRGWCGVQSRKREYSLLVDTERKNTILSKIDNCSFGKYMEYDSSSDIDCSDFLTEAINLYEN